MSSWNFADSGFFDALLLRLSDIPARIEFLGTIQTEGGTG
jgi:hypothetical protein